MNPFTWPQQVQSGQYRHDLASQDATSLWVPDATQHDGTWPWVPDATPHDGAWPWDASCTAQYSGNSTATPFNDSAISSPDSYHSAGSFRTNSIDGSYFDGSPRCAPLDDGGDSDLKAAGRPKKGTLENRIKRRRTQNRNSQRAYRQRRIEERDGFESRATAAEETSRQLQSHVNELESEVLELTEQITDLELENTQLRSRKSSIA